MKLINTKLEGVYIIENLNFCDHRGSFTKTYLSEFIDDFKIKESYYSVNNKDVIRGMHFQLPPHDHEKLVYVPKGSIVDVVLDLRAKSNTYKHFIEIELNSLNKRSVFIPKGLAHGFKSLEDNTITVYNVSTQYNPLSDSGVNFNSFGYNWKINNPTISERDKNLTLLKNFKSPF